MQYGIADENEFTTVNFDTPAPSSMSKWPSDRESESKYKVVSSYVTLSMDQNVIERQTYSVLEWLGDVGGLYDMLGLIGGALIGPLAAFSLKAELLTQAFRYTASLVNAENREKKLNPEKKNRKKVPSVSDLDGN